MTEHGKKGVDPFSEKNGQQLTDHAAHEPVVIVQATTTFDFIRFALFEQVALALVK